MRDLVELALERAMSEKPAVDRGDKRRVSSALQDTLREAWDAMEKKDFDSFSESFHNAVKICSAESDEDLD